MSCVLGVIGFAAICVVAAIYPTLTAYVIFGVVAVMAVRHFIERMRETNRIKKGNP